MLEYFSSDKIIDVILIIWNLWNHQNKLNLPSSNVPFLSLLSPIEASLDEVGDKVDVKSALGLL